MKNSIPIDENGKLEFLEIEKLHSKNFWESRLALALEECKLGIQKNSRLKKYKEYYEANTCDILVAIGDWISKIDNACASTNFNLTGYLYGGDPFLKVERISGNAPDGIECALASKLMLLRNLATLYVFFCRKNSYDVHGTQRESRYEFARIILENVRQMLVDTWNYDFLKESLSGLSSKLPIANAIESVFFNYGLLKAPTRKIRIIRAVSNAKNLPIFSDINKKHNLISSIIPNFDDSSIDSTQEAAGIAENIWESHIQATNCKGDSSNFNSIIDDVLDNIVFGELRESEKARNKTSGNVGRTQKRKLEHARSSGNEAGSNAALERLRKLNPVAISLEEGQADKIPEQTQAYCPDDVSDAVWNRITEEEKIYLAVMELTNSAESTAGLKGILTRHLGAESATTPQNVIRFILCELLGIDIGRVSLANSAGAKVQIEKIIRANACIDDIRYTLGRILSSKITSLLTDKSDPSNVGLRDKIFEIHQEFIALSNAKKGAR